MNERAVQTYLRIWRNVEDDTVIIHAALHSVHTHITCHLKQIAAFFGGKQ